MALPRDEDPLRQPLPRVAIARSRLVDRLSSIDPGGLGLVIAAAGSGKSVLLRQWAAAQPADAVVAFGCTPRHDDAALLAGDLLATLVPLLGPDATGLQDLVLSSGSALGDSFVVALSDALTAVEDDPPRTLVVEDLHALTNRAVVEDLGRILTALPRSVRAIVSARRDPPWPVRRLRMTDQLVEVRGSDLAFGPAEARTLLTGVSDRSLTDDQVASLLDRTDGWVAGLQLAAVSLQRVSDVDDFVASFAGSDRLVSEYLLGEVFEGLEPRLRRFLLETSVLRWLSPELCDAVTGRDDARTTLKQLEALSLFVIPLDASGESFRYHHLFADLLVYQLRAQEPSAEPVLHRRAAQWLHEHGRPEEAIDHLVAAGDHAGAFGLISTRGHVPFEQGSSTSLVRWLSLLYGATERSSLDVGVSLMAAQVAADQLVSAAETRRQMMKRPDVRVADRVALDALYAGCVIRSVPPALAHELAANVRALSPQVPPGGANFMGVGGIDTVRAFADAADGFAWFLEGDLSAAAATLEELVSAPALAYAVWRSHVLSMLGLVRAWTGNPVEALRVADTALEVATEAGFSEHVAVTYAHMARGLALTERGDLTAAAAALAESERANRRRPPTVVHYFDVQRCLMARLTAATEGAEAAIALLRQPPSSPVEPPVLARANLGLMVRLLIGDNQLAAARELLEGESSPALAPVMIDLAMASGDIDAARAGLSEWQPDVDDERALVGHRLRTAVVLAAAGDREAAVETLRGAIARADQQGLRWTVAEVPGALRLWRGIAPRRGSFTDPATTALADLWDPRQRDQAALVDPLTERELAVLDYLPGRIRNQRIAEELYISVNTLKTHLRAIYRKLDVADRDEAVSRATELGLL